MSIANFNWKKFLLFSIPFLILVLVSAMILPPLKDWKQYESTRIKYPDLFPEQDYSSYIVVVFGGVLIIFLSILMPNIETPMVEETTTILEKTENKKTMAHFRISGTPNILKDKYVGEFGIGHLKAVSIINDDLQAVYMVLIGDNNLLTRETAARFPTQILSKSYEIDEIEKEMEHWMSPTERGTQFNRLKNMLKEISRTKSKKSAELTVGEAYKAAKEDEAEAGA